MKLPMYLIFGARPVKFVATDDGGLDIRAFDWETGDFVRALEYGPRFFKFEPEMDEVTEDEFNRRVAALRRDLGGRTAGRERERK